MNQCNQKKKKETKCGKSYLTKKRKKEKKMWERLAIGNVL